MPDDGFAETLIRLRALHAKAGSPSTRELAQAAGCSHTTVAYFLAGHWGSAQTVTKIITALDGNPADFPMPEKSRSRRVSLPSISMRLAQIEAHIAEILEILRA